MNILVLVFFIHNVLATLLLGCKFASKGDKTLKNFGIALLFDAVAFAIWSVAIALKPDNLETYVTAGVVFFIVSLFFFLLAGIQNLSQSNRQILTWVGAIIALVVLYLRAFVYPSNPGFSDQGFFFFNPDLMAQMLYIFGLLLTAVPAIDAVAAKFRAPYGGWLRYGFLAEVAGGVVLLTSSLTNPDTLALNITGYIIALVYLVLWTTFVFNPKVWA